MTSPTHGSPADDPAWLQAEQRLLLAGTKLLTALREYEKETSDYRDGPLSCLDMDDVMGGLSAISGSLEQELLQLHKAIGMIDENTQIAPKSARGVAWQPYLSPRWLLYFADLAKPDDPGYLPQLLDRLAAADARWREQNAACGRPTRTGAPCRAVPVYWPGRGRDSACTRHLTPEEKRTLEDLWSEIERIYSCPGCLSPAGKPCSEDAEPQVLPSGDWPRIRGFAGRKMHDARLYLGEPDATE